jgi:hypothetical protein
MIDIMEPTQYRQKIIRSHTQQTEAKTRFFRSRFFVALCVGLGITGLLIGWYLIWGTSSVVPKKIQRSVDFAIYYPGTLVPGYVLDVQSFRLAEPGVVIFAVTHGKDKNIVFSEQDQPSSSDIDKFISTYLPLNSDVKLPLGQAKVGAYGSAPNIRTVMSLPIRNGPWVIVTAPSDINHDDLVKLLASLKK